MNENELAKIIFNCSLEVHKSLGGPGLLESVYEEALFYELSSKGLNVVRQKQIPIIYKGHQLSTPLRLDLLVNNKVIVEVKAVKDYNPIFENQVLTYLRLSNLKLGVVINLANYYCKRVSIGL